MPVSLKFGSTYWRWRDDILRSRSDRDFTCRRRTAALAALLSEAYAGSDFWWERIAKALGADMSPTQIGFESLAALPVLTREELRKVGEAALTVGADTLDPAFTSGSSGHPFSFWLDKDRSPREFAFVNDVWARTGYQEGDARCVLRGLELADLDQQPCEWEAGLSELRCAVFSMTAERMDRCLDMIDHHGIAYLHGYPSAIEILCRHICRTGRRLKRPILGVFPISEPVHGRQRAVVRAALPDAAIAPFYGLSEHVLFASEVDDAEDVYEFEPLYGHPELVDDRDQAVAEPGCRGRILGTGLLSTGMPFIGYDTGDAAELVRPATAENGWRMRVRDIRPRRQAEFLVGVNSDPSATLTLVPEYCFSVDPSTYGVSEVQFYQDEPGRCTIKVVPAAGCGEADVRPFVEATNKQVGSRIRFAFELVEDLAGDARGKRPFIDQRLDLRHLVNTAGQ